MSLLSVTRRRIDTTVGREYMDDESSSIGVEYDVIYYLSYNNILTKP